MVCLGVDLGWVLRTVRTVWSSHEICSFSASGSWTIIVTCAVYVHNLFRTLFWHHIIILKFAYSRNLLENYVKKCVWLQNKCNFSIVIYVNFMFHHHHHSFFSSSSSSTSSSSNSFTFVYYLTLFLSYKRLCMNSYYSEY